MKTFVGYKGMIEEFHGDKSFGNDFKPIQYKTQVVDGIIYTIQYQTSEGIVQATVYVPAVKRTVEGTVKVVHEGPEVTQFVDVDGTVTGAGKLTASLMMVASLIATVMLS